MIARFFQRLESRTLFAATTMTVLVDQSAVAGDVSSLHADLAAYAASYKGDVKALTADLKALPKSKQNVSLMNKLRTDQNKCAATLRADFAHMMAVDGPVLHKLTTDGMRVLMHPLNAEAKAKVAADSAALQTVGAAALAKFTADLSACGHTVSTDATALAAANPSATKLATDLHSAQAHVTAVITAIEAGLSKRQADLVKLMTDLSA